MLLKAILVVLFVVSAILLDRIMMFEPVLRAAFYLAVVSEVFQQITLGLQCCLHGKGTNGI